MIEKVKAMEQYRAFLQERQKSDEMSNKNHKELVEKNLNRSIREVVENVVDVKYVILFGSFVEGHFNRNSDIDIYMEGLSPKDYFDVKRKLEDETGVDIDLHNQDDSQQFISRIKERGILLYERETGASDSGYS